MKLGCACSFIVTIDMWCILFVINLYLNLKTYSIILINCLDRVVQRKLNEAWGSWKRFKALWMGHGAWMGIAWGNMEDGCMGLKHNFQNITCFGGLGCPCIETCVELLANMWHVLVGGRFQGSSFKAHVLWCMFFDRPKWAPSYHWNMIYLCVGLLWGPHCSCMETCARLLRSEWHISDLH